MNYSTKAKQLHELVSKNPGILVKDLVKWYDAKMIARLVRERVLVPGQTRRTGVGRPSKTIYAGTAPPQARSERLRVPKPRKRVNQDRIIEFLTVKGEATLRQIADCLGKAPGHISGTVLVMAAEGKIVRRRILGKIAGRTQSCEWYAYRLP